MEGGADIPWTRDVNTYHRIYLISIFFLNLGHEPIAQAKHKSHHIYFQFSQKHQLDEVFELGII